MTGILVLFCVYMQVIHHANIGQVLETLDAEGNHWWYGRPVPAAEDIVLTTGAALFNIGVLFWFFNPEVGVSATRRSAG